MEGDFQFRGDSIRPEREASCVSTLSAVYDARFFHRVVGLCKEGFCLKR